MKRNVDELKFNNMSREELIAVIQEKNAVIQEKDALIQVIQELDAVIQERNQHSIYQYLKQDAQLPM